MNEFGGKTLEEIGAILGCTRERARQIKITALAKIKKKLNLNFKLLVSECVVRPSVVPDMVSRSLSKNHTEPTFQFHEIHEPY